jgi:hypothetical protein
MARQHLAERLRLKYVESLAEPRVVRQQTMVKADWTFFVYDIATLSLRAQ